MTRSLVGRFTEPAITKALYTVAKEQFLFRAGFAYRYTLADLFIIEGNRMLSLHVSSMKKKDTPDVYEDFSGAYLRIVEGPDAMVEEIGIRSVGWRFFPIWYEPRQVIAIVRDPGYGKHHECFPDEMEYFLGLSEVLDFALSKNYSSAEKAFLDRAALRVMDYIFLDVATYPGRR